MPQRNLHTSLRPARCGGCQLLYSCITLKRFSYLASNYFGLPQPQPVGETLPTVLHCRISVVLLLWHWPLGPDFTRAIAYLVLYGIHLIHEFSSYFHYVRFYHRTYVTLQFCGGVLCHFSVLPVRY